MLKRLKFKNVDLEIVKLENWSRKKYFDEYENHWIPASPNIPTVHSAAVYPGTCLFEATNISEGRGTTRPFEIIGAPFVDSMLLIKEISCFKISGAVFRPVFFKPTFDKFKNEVCSGIFIHITDRKKFKPVRTALIVIYLLKKLYKKQFKWYAGAYEYEKTKPAIDILYGSDSFRNSVDCQTGLEKIFSEMDLEEKQFSIKTKEWRIYK